MRAVKRPFSITNLREKPRFREAVADRIWRAWWSDKGYPLDYIAGRVNESLTAPGIPVALVAHDGDRFLGTASLIESDMEARPEYTPWVAAVWVDPAYRGLGLGSALVQEAAAAGLGIGHDVVYLCASPANSRFYERLGWERIEEDVAGLNVFRLMRDT